MTAWAGRLRAREVSSVEVARTYLDRIRRLDGRLRAFITVCEDEVLQDARAADEAFAQGRATGMLAGVPLALKDLIWTAGVRTTSGSRTLEDFTPGQDAAVWECLRREGALLLGKLNLHEFAYGTTGTNAHFGDVRNPWDESRIAGGSSSGGAAAVAADLTPATLGTDTGGSIRIPAACCGIYGLKPTFGRVSAYGVQPLAPSLDHVGPMSRSVRDLALLMNALAGYDERDPYSARMTQEDFGACLEASTRGLRIGVERSYFAAPADPAVLHIFEEALQTLREAGMIVEDIELPGIETVPDVQTVILGAEALALHRERLAAQADLYGGDVRDRLLSAAGFSAVDYAMATQLRVRWRRVVQSALERLDAIVLPILPFPAPPLRAQETVVEGRTLSVRGYLNRWTNPFNLAGIPVCAAPFGRTPDGLPAGVQIAGQMFAESRVLQVARVLERARPFAAPPLAL